MMRAKRTPPWSSCVLVILLVSLMQGCISGASSTRKTSSLRATKRVTASAAELSSRNQSILSLYSGEVEAAADKIILESPSPIAKRQALVWKAEAIPVLQTTLLNTDPVAAVLDTWVFLYQMTAYMDRPAIKQRLGESHSDVSETLRNMDAQMTNLVQRGAPTASVADIGEQARRWAEGHPIQTSLAGRQSVDAEVIRKVGQTDMGTMASIQTLGESLGDLTARMDSYNVYLPKQARWQAELLLRDIASDTQVKTALSNIGALSTALAKTTSNLDRMPELMGETRQAINSEVTGQRLATQTFLRDERLETLLALKQERIAIVAAMDRERLAGTADLRAERQILLNESRNQEAAVLQSVDALTEKAIQDVDRRSRILIDHFFVRALELVLFTLVSCALIGWVLLRRYMPARPQRPEKLYDRAA